MRFRRAPRHRSGKFSHHLKNFVSTRRMHATFEETVKASAFREKVAKVGKVAAGDVV